MEKPDCPAGKLLLGLKIRPLRFTAQFDGRAKEYELFLTPETARRVGSCLVLLATDQENWLIAQQQDAQQSAVEHKPERAGPVPVLSMEVN